MAELERKKLSLDDRQLFLEVVDTELTERGYSSQTVDREFDERIENLPGEMRALVEAAYYFGRKDGLARVDAEESFFSGCLFAMRLRNDLEGKFKSHLASQRPYGPIQSMYDRRYIELVEEDFPEGNQVGDNPS